MDANLKEEMAAILPTSPNSAIPPTTGDACSKSGTPFTSPNGAGAEVESTALRQLPNGACFTFSGALQQSLSRFVTEFRVAGVLPSHAHRYVCFT